MKKVSHTLQKVSLYTIIVNHLHACICMICILECKSVFASMMLVHLLPDTRTAATASRIVVFINVSMHVYMYD